MQESLPRVFEEKTDKTNTGETVRETAMFVSEVTGRHLKLSHMLSVSCGGVSGGWLWVIG